MQHAARISEPKDGKGAATKRPASIDYVGWKERELDWTSWIWFGGPRGGSIWTWDQAGSGERERGGNVNLTI